MRRPTAFLVKRPVLKREFASKICISRSSAASSGSRPSMQNPSMRNICAITDPARSLSTCTCSGLPLSNPTNTSARSQKVVGEAHRHSKTFTWLRAPSPLRCRVSLDPQPQRPRECPWRVLVAPLPMPVRYSNIVNATVHTDMRMPMNIPRLHPQGISDMRGHSSIVHTQRSCLRA